MDTVEKHYAPFVKELRDRARRLMENGEGLEKTDCTIITQQPSERADSVKELENKKLNSG